MYIIFQAGTTDVMLALFGVLVCLLIYIMLHHGRLITTLEENGNLHVEDSVS